jgi:hypothetical protein
MSPDGSPRRRTLVVIVDADLIAAHVAAGKLPIQLIAAAVFKAEPGAKFFGLDRHELSTGRLRSAVPFLVYPDRHRGDRDGFAL